jgi:hypothetical protein
MSFSLLFSRTPLPRPSCLGQFAWLANSVLLASVLLLTGCEPKPEISRYTVPKESVIDKGVSQVSAAAESVPKQTLGAIFVHGETGWFFKASDDPAKLTPLTSRLREFVESVRFAAGADAEPTWTMPEGWTREAGNQFRFATIRTGASPTSPEISVTKLPGPADGDLETFVLLNVNRWRNQLTLPPLDKEELKGETEKIKASELEGTWVDITGKGAAGNSMAAPFAGGAAGPAVRPPVLPGPASTTQATGSGIKYAAPEGWKEEPAGGFRKASFKVKDGEQLLDVSVSDLSAQAGELLPNINRWRQQVKLPEIDQAELDKQLQPVKMGDVDGQLIEIVGGSADGSGKETILGAIAVHGDKAWFVKARGPAALAAREKARFEQFVRSLQFE